ncbi:unnamed protein product [Gordionus sp. m RMFG-2023]
MKIKLPNYNITALRMSTTYLDCHLHNISKEETISWMRLGDNQILSIGDFKFIEDPRITIINQPKYQNSKLKIRYINKDDEGFYECQFTTEIDKIGLIFNLTVVSG